MRGTGDPSKSFHDMLEILSVSKAPLSVRFDVPYKPTVDELQIARRAVGHVMADADVRGRIASLKVEPLVRASSIVLEDAKAGKAAKAQREISESIAEYLGVLDEAFGALPSVLNNRGVARTLIGDLNGASADFASARRLAPTFAAAKYNEISVLRRKGDFAHLERVAEEIEKADPGNTEALRALVDAKVGLKRPTADVLPLARKLYEAKAARPADLLLLGSLAEGAGHPEEAEGYLRESIAGSPKEPEGHLRLAAVLLEQGKPAQALEVYEKLTEIDGPKHEYLLAIALVYDQMGRVEDAANAFDFALEHASALDQEIIERAFDEFKQRRGKAKEAPPSAPEHPSAPFDVEEPDLREPQVVDKVAAPAHAQPLVPDLSHDEFQPKTVGEAELFGLSEKEVPLGEAPGAPAAAPPPSEVAAEAPVPEAPEPPAIVARPAPAPPIPEAPTVIDEVAPPAPPTPEPPTVIDEVAPPAPTPAETEEDRIVRALEGSDAEDSWADDIMGEEPSAPAVEGPEEHKPEPAAPHEVPAAPEESPPETEAIVVARSEAIVVKQAPPEPEVAPVVSSPAPAPGTPRPEPAPRPAGPVVSAPPPAESADAPDDVLTAELDALAKATPGDEVAGPSEPEAFQRPSFDVDDFMAALEAKTKPVFDHLYDGMLEARRKDTAETKPDPGTTPSLYESAAPTELPSTPSAPAAPTPAPAQPPEAPPVPAAPPIVEPPPVMPALFRGPAKEAIEQAAREARPHDPSLLPKAEELLRSGDAAGAEAALDKYLSTRQDDAHAWNLKGDLRERAEDERGAIDCFWKAVKYDPSLREAWNNLGVLLHLGGRFEDAAGAFESAVRTAPDDRHLWHNLGSTYHELGRLRDAINAFNKAIEIDPSDKVSFNNKGTTLFELGEFNAAKASFEKAAQIDPNFEQALNNLGRTLEKLNDREGAVKSFEAALALNGTSRTALKNLARVLRDLGRGGEANAAESRLSALGT